MDLKSIYTKSVSGIKKYKFIALILIVGITLMLIPESKEKTDEPIQTDTIEANDIIVAELEDLLSKISGAGEVKVMLTVQYGEQIIYQSDDDQSENANTSDSNSKTVIINDNERNQAGLIKQIIPPIYQGAVIICDGADNPAVKLAIVSAVSNLTGLGANKISVLKMK